MNRISKRICVAVIAVTMVFTMVPTVAFATSTSENQQAYSIAEQSKALYQHKVVHGISNELAYYKQLVREYLDLMLNENRQKQSMYSVEVWKAIEEIYNREIEKVDNAKDASSLLIISDFGLLPSEQVTYSATSIEMICSYTKDQYNSTGDLAGLKKGALHEINSTVSSTALKSIYNEFYASMASGILSKSKTKIQKATTIKDFAEAIAYAQMYLNLDDYTDEDNEDDEDDEESSDYDSYFTTHFATLSFEAGLCSNATLKELKTEAVRFIDNYVTRQLKISKYSGSTSQVKAIAEAATKKIKAGYDADTITITTINAVDSMINLTGVEYENLTLAKRTRLTNKLNEMLESYDPKLYAESSYEDIEDIFSAANDAVDTADMVAELPYDIVASAKQLADKVPTYKEELAKLKVADIKKLNTFIGNPKYSQTKVKPIISKGVSLIKQATTLTKVRSLYSSYRAKALKTIKTFTVTTSKTGYGSVTPKKIVKYGGSVKIKLVPKKGYKIYRVYINGKSVKVKTTYTFANVKKNYTLKAAFKKR